MSFADTGNLCPQDFKPGSLSRVVADERARSQEVIADLLTALEHTERFLMGKARRDPVERAVVEEISLAIAKGKAELR